MLNQRKRVSNMMIPFKSFYYALTMLALMSWELNAQNLPASVKVVGEMRNVMWKGQLSGTIQLDTIAHKTHLYGLGPVEYLSGEILILDGKSYVSRVLSDSTMKVEESYELKAPFFGYANISQWTEQPLPDSVVTLQDLEVYLDSITKSSPRPFFFKLKGIVEEGIIHIVNLPEGSVVRSPDDAHQGQVNYPIRKESADIVGFFSTQHKAILTHHDTYLHLHLITTDRLKMGHVDEVRFQKGSMMLYLPKWE